MPTDTDTRTSRPALANRIIPVALVALLGLLVGLVVGGGADEALAEQIAGPGPLVAWGLPIVRLVATIASVLVVGLLGYA
ncbi:MAG: hypothetical protein MUD05_01540, partial [Candidatus Nanopelagicales bacterium]|nr:hypothetical protein [Candidatus Nanopelagicales bacterium]